MSRSLVQFARFKPLAAWSVSASVLGTALALYVGGGTIAAPLPMAVAVACVVLMQYVAHPMNDLMDFELDSQAPITSTGRHKPLVDRSITAGEAKGLTAALVAVILVMMSYLIVRQPVLLLPALYGMVALFGYNHPRLRWAYKPYTELYLSMPINALSVLVVSFIGSGTLTGEAVALSLSFGFASSTFFVSMMSMDYLTDRANGKVTTVVRWPRLHWCTYYPLIGLLVSLVAIPLAFSGAPVTAASLAVLATAVFTLLAAYGRRADRLRLDCLDASCKGHEGATGRLRLRQLYISLVYALLVPAFLLIPRW